MRAWLLTYVTAEPVEAVILLAAGVCAIVAVVMALKVARELHAMLHEAEDMHEDWCGENYGAHRW